MKLENQLDYVRLNMEDFKQTFHVLLKKFQDADNFEIQNEAFVAINQLRLEFQASEQLVYLRHMIDLNNELYKEEQDFFDKISPIYQSVEKEFYQEMIKATYRNQLETRWGSQIFRIAELKVKSFSEDIAEELKLEKELVGRYFSLLGSAEIDFNGSKVPLFGLNRYTISSDRHERKQAFETMASFYAAHEMELAEIFDQLIKVRTKMAKKLGYDTFTQLGYDRLKRTNYTAKEVEVYRDQVKLYGVPFISKLREKQRERIGVDKLKFYDERFHFKTGAPRLLGDANEIIKQARTMFSELSPETKEFFEDMLERGNMDLLSKKGKRGGAFATFVGTEKAPFIFTNFVGTPNDVRVLTHETGHAFQFYMSRNTPIPEYIAPTFDATEIFSFSMERFAWPWIESFFGEDAEKYKFSHLTEAFILMPWANAIDEFQHYLYENSSATPEERKAKWREIERIYMPEKDYDGNEFYEMGGSFYQIGHLFETPFYFIDYDLAHNCAVQLWIRSNEDRRGAWHDFLKICRVGGSESLVEIIERARLQSPFEAGSLKYIIEYVDRWVEQFDDGKF